MNALRSITISTTCALLLGFGAICPCAHGAGQDLDLQRLDREFKRVVSKVAPSVVDVQIHEEALEVTEGKTAALKRTRLLRCSGVIGSKGGEIITLLRDGVPQPVSGGEIIIEVTLHDGQVYNAQLTAIDRVTGVTLLKLENPPRGLKPVTANSKGLTSGSLVVAVGSSEGTTHSVKFGWVSSVDRRVRSQSFAFPRAILTDIPVEPGAVGGMLANARGEMVGLLAFSYSPGQGARRVSGRGMNANQEGSSSVIPRGSVMAIPSDLLKHICSHLRRHGKVIRGAVEASFRFYTARQLQRLGVPAHQSGAQVMWVGTGGAADRAGLEAGDVVVQVNDGLLKTRSDLNRLAEIVEFGKVGTLLSLKILRTGGDFPSVRIIQVSIGQRRDTVRNVPVDERE